MSEVKMDRMRIVTVGALAGLGLGASAVAWAQGIRGALGAAPDADVTAASLLAIGCLLGARVRGGSRALGISVLGIGLLGAVVGAWSTPLGAALARLGGSLDAGAAGIAFARTIVAGIVLLPLGALLGAAARAAGPALGTGRTAPGALALLAVGGGTGALAATILRLEGAPGWAGYGGSVILGLVGIGLALRAGGAPHEDAAPSPGSGVAAAATGFAIAAFAFLAPRSFSFAFGHELPGFPVVGVSLAAGLAIGAFGAAAVAHLVPRLAGATGVAALLAVGGAAVVVGPGRLDEHPVAFLAAIESLTELSDVVDAALRLVFPSVAGVGAAFGAAAVLLLVAAPDAGRGRWLARVAGGAAVGALAGTVLARFGPGTLSIPGTIAGAAGVTAGLAAVGAGRTPGRKFVAVPVGLAGIALVIWAAVRVPAPDPRMLLPERHFVTRRAGVELRGWVQFEQDGANESVAVVRRGRSRRLLVDGRLEATNGLATRTDGVLAHLPLAVHPSPARVLLLGLGNGAALTAVVAHSTERIDCVERGPAFAAASATFGDSVRSALADERVRLRFGDPEDLVARAGRYDVLLNQASGAWTALSSRLSTVEFLETARDRLEDDGLYCHRVPVGALTKKGFLSLLATIASVFPQVEVWSGHHSAVVILAKKTAAPHDFAAILDAYRTPRVQLAAGDVWLEEPLSLLSHFLVSDPAVRRLARRTPLHTREHDELGRGEAARRRRASTVNPVPGLFALGDDLLATLVNTPETGFEAAVANAIRARALERAALDQETRRNGPQDMKALETWETAAQLNPRDRVIRRHLADLRSRMGIEYTNQQSVAAGYSNLRKAVEIDTTFAEGFANLGRHLAMSDEYDFAVAVTEHAIELEPDNDLFALLIAQIWKRRTYYDKALPWYEKAMELNPRNVAAAIGYVDTKLAMEEEPDLEHGLEISRRYLEFEPENEELQSRIAKLELAIETRATDGTLAPPGAEPASTDSSEVEPSS